MDACTIDGLVERHGLPDVLFIDVVGFEHRVLCGAERTLRTRPDCFVEVHVDTGLTEVGDTVQDVLTHFSPDDYDLFVASATETEHEFVPIEKARWRLQERFYLVALSRA